MSQENVELVRGLQPDAIDLVEMFRGENREALVAVGSEAGIFTPDAEIRFIALADTVGMDYRGPQGLIDGWRDFLEGYERYVVELEDLLDAGDQVVALVRVKAMTARDGVEVEHQPAAVWTIGHKKVVGLTFHLDREQALKAAGLRE